MPVTDLERPSAYVSGTVSDLAAQIFHLRAWWDEAKLGGAKLGRDGIADLLATMVHPPPPPPGAPQWVWIQRVQIAAALILANTDKPIEAIGPLSQALFGPVDWSVDAAAIALGLLAETHPDDADVCRAVDQAFAVRFQATPERGYTCYLHPLVCAWLRVPGVEPADRDRLLGWKAHLEQRG